jgi:hypothetical protein
MLWSCEVAAFITPSSVCAESGGSILMARKKVGIVGKWFLAFNQEGNLDLQGRVLERMKEGIYLIETYGWTEGEVYDERIISVDKMCNWRLYPDFETFGLRAQQHLKSENAIL